MTQSSAQLERDAEETRARLAATLDELRSRITPGEFVDQTLDFAQDTGLPVLARNLARDARDNPLPLLLIGAGVAWLMFGKRSPSIPRRGDGYGAAVEESAATAAQIADDAASRGRELAHTAADKASAAYHDATAAGGDAARRVGWNTAAAGRGFARFCREQPLILAGVGLALGAALGAMLPATEPENRLAGSGDEIKQPTSDFVVDPAGRVAESASILPPARAELSDA